MIKLTVLVARNPHLTVEEFHHGWRAHGRVIAEEPAFRPYLRRYEQHHRSVADYRNGGAFDGLAVQWYDRHADFLAFIDTPEYHEKVRPDEARLLDMDRLVVLFTDDAEVFVP